MWLKALHKGYDITFCGLQQAIKRYADDDIFVTNSIEDMATFLEIGQQFSDWYGIRLRVGKCQILANATIHGTKKTELVFSGSGTPTSPWADARTVSQRMMSPS
jgi:hypothetical protein